MTTKQELERRILSKVSPISREPTEPTQLPQLPHNHQKGIQCRSCRTLRKIAKQERDTEIARQAASIAKGFFRELGKDTAQVASGVANAHGEMFRGWLGNTDPITWAAGGVAVGVYVTTLLIVLNKVGKVFGIKNLADDLGVAYLTNLPASVTASIDKTFGRDDSGGTFGIAIIDSSGNVVENIRWYDTQLARAAAVVLLEPVAIAGGHAAVLWKRRFTPGGGFVSGPDAVIDSTPNTNFPGQYTITETLVSGEVHIIPAGTDQAAAQATLAYLEKSVPSIYTSVTLNAPS